jgi:hypothetical protein
MVEGEGAQWSSCQVKLACPKPEIESEDTDRTVRIVLKIAIHSILISQVMPCTSSVGNEPDWFATDRTEQGFGSDSIRDLRISTGSSQTDSRTMIFERKSLSEFLSDRLDFWFIL